MMPYINTILSRRLTRLSLVISILALNFAPIWNDRAYAQFVVSDPPVEIATGAIAAATAANTTRETGRHIADSAAMIAARLAVQLVVQSTVSWAQSGFDGNPAYVTDPEQYFTDLADGIAGDYIKNNKNLEFLCSPFQTQVRLALREQYLQQPNFQCTLTGIVGNIEAFYEDFNQGGWDAWFAMTQNNSNNPYGAYVEAQIDLDSRIANAVGLKNQELDWNQGFLSFKKCTGSEIPDGMGGTACLDANGNTAPTKTVTPGSIVKSGLDKVLPSGVESLITVNHIEQLIEAFATGLLKKYVFGPEGLFGGGSKLPITTPGSSTTGPGSGVQGIDIDGDNINDIIFVGDEYSCVYDGTYPNCQGSKTAAANSGVVWGYVFSDTNANGTQDSGENMLSGIGVYLKTPDGEDAGTSSTFNGIYTFGSLANGQTYVVGVNAPSGSTVVGGNDVSVTANPLTPNQPVKNFGLTPESQ